MAIKRNSDWTYYSDFIGKNRCFLRKKDAKRAENEERLLWKQQLKEIFKEYTKILIEKGHITD